MRKTAFYCNHCGVLIEGSVHKVFISEVNENEDIKNDQPLEKELENIHLCGPCARALISHIQSNKNMIPQEADTAPAPKRGRPKKDDAKKKEQIAIAMKKYKQATGQ